MTEAGAETGVATARGRVALAGFARRLLRADLAVIAAPAPPDEGGSLAPDFLCRAADGVPGVPIPPESALLGASHSLLTLAAAEVPERVSVGQDATLQALLTDATTAYGAGVRGPDGDLVGVVLGVARGPLDEVDARSWRALMDLVRDALGSEPAREAPRGQGVSTDLDSTPVSTQASVRAATYRRLLDESADFVWRVDLADPLPADASTDERVAALSDTGRVGEANVAFAGRFGGVRPADVEGRLVRDLPNLWLFEDESRLAHAAAIGFDRCSLAVTEAKEEGGTLRLDARLIADVDAHGLRGFWCIETDVTEATDAHETQRAAAELYGAGVRASYDASCVIDADTRVIDCDDSFAHLVGSEREALLGAALPIVVSSRTSPSSRLDVGTIGEHGTWRGRGEIPRPGGDPIPIEMLCVQSSRSQGLVHGFVRDMRGPLSVQKGEVDHRQALAQVARLSTLGEMTSGIAHELNQPLAAIVNYANGCVRRLDQQGSKDEVMLRALRSIADQGRRAAEIIRRMRSFARRTDEKREPFSVSDLLSEAIELTASQRRRAGIDLDTHFEASPDDVLVDGIQIEQVALHLLRNAIDALERTHEDDLRTIRVDTRLTHAQGTGEPSVEVTILDSGPGVPEEDAFRIFDPFYTTRNDGLGLGLTISRSIIESHAGRLRLVQPTDDADRGSCFRFTLPLRAAPIEP